MFILRFVLNSPYSSFYRNKYGKIKNPTFSRLPFLTREEIDSTLVSKRLYVPENQVAAWSMSSGTTQNQPVLIPKIAHKDDRVYNMLGDLLKKHQVKKVLTLTRITFLNTRTRLWTSNPKLTHYPVIIGDPNNFGLTAKMSAQIEIDALETTPSILHYFLPFLKEHYDLSKIKLISLGSESTSERQLKLFKSFFQKAVFYFRMAGSEYPVGHGFRCKYLVNSPPRFFHPDTNFYLYEVIDENGEQVKEQEKGELVITTLKKCAFPLIRYKTGDAISLYQQKCQCGENMIIEMFGRIGYDFVKAGGVSLRSDMVEQALSKSGIKTNSDYQLHIYEAVNKDKLAYKLVLKLPGKTAKKMQHDFEDNFYIGRNVTLKNLIKEGVFLPLVVEELKKEAYAGKKIRIISHLS